MEYFFNIVYDFSAITDINSVNLSECLADCWDDLTQIWIAKRGLAIKTRKH